jgi:hypothetical protein
MLDAAGEAPPTSRWKARARSHRLSCNTSEVKFSDLSAALHLAVVLGVLSFKFLIDDVARYPFVVMPPRVL